MNTFLLFFLGCGLVTSTKYILVPKVDVFKTAGLSMAAAAEFYNLSLLAEFQENEHSLLSFYTSEHSNLLAYRDSLSRFYDIEEDKQIRLSSSQFVWLNKTVPWHLDRVVRRTLPLENDYPYADKGICHTNSSVSIDTYIVDTGIDIEHPQFQGHIHEITDIAVTFRQIHD